MMENRYDKYKDSGVEWIGEIPEHWEIKRLKNVCSQVNIKENSKGNSLPYIGLENIESGSGRYIDTISEIEGMANRFCKNNVLFGKLRPYLSKVYLAEKDGICSTEFIVYDTKSNNCRFIHKLLLSPLFIDVVNSSTYGAKMPRANSEFINNIYVQIPPLPEQQSIATYLDQKCGEIDELITLQEEMITKLQSYKQSVITEAVTKGLDKNVPLKDSGIKWIGKIPEHWKITKVQYLAQLKSGYNLTTEEITDNGLYPVYGGNGIRGYYDKYFLEGDYVLIGRQGALCGNINYSTNKSWATEHAVVCYPKIKYVTRWFGELLRVMNLNQYSLAAAQPGLAVERIKLLPIPIIPLSEQQAIADYLNQRCSEIDELISIKQQKIEKLKEYKKSLIFECVTGKRKVS